jgi:(p)ppGpp synthase/HD superfamily hydrolase
MLTSRFTDAIDYARVAHAAQTRKGSGIPYIYHLLGVASIVIEFGGSENQAIAALLHDVIEDCGDSHRESVRTRFGEEVAHIVEACTDGSAESKASHQDAASKRVDWTRRKLSYLDHLANADPVVLLVSGSDKLHNARAIVQDLEDPRVGVQVFDRFTGGRDGTLGYYQSLATIFAGHSVPIAWQLNVAVERMHQLAGTDERRPLQGRL